MTRIVIATKFFAPYRFHFYELLGKPGELECSIILEQSVPDDHPWKERPESLFTGSIHIAGKGIRGLTNLIAGLEKARPSLVYVTEYSAYAVTAMAWALARGIPYVLATDTGRDAPGYARKWYSPIWQPIWRHFSCGIVACTCDAERTSRSMGKRTFFAPHASHLDSTPLPDIQKAEPVTFLFVGRLLPHKGVLELLEAGKCLAARSTIPFRVRIIGAGNLRDQLEEEATNSTWLEIGSFREGTDLIREYQMADVFVLATHEDTYAVVVHEAAKNSLPLIVSTAAGAAEVLVKDGRTGILIKPKSVDSLLAAMRELLDDPAKRKVYGDNAMELAAEYDSKKLAAACRRWILEFLHDTQQQ